MLQFPVWKKVLIWSICIFGVLLATPNLKYSNVEAHNDALAVIEQLPQDADVPPALQAKLNRWPNYLP